LISHFFSFGQKFFKNDAALPVHLPNPALGVYLEYHAALGTDFSVEF